MAGYYRRFVQDYAKISHPLTELLHNDVPWQWKEAQDQAFCFLKEKLVSAPILATPDFDIEFVVHCDASNIGLGAVLSQKVDGRNVVIQYASRTLNSTERKYSTTERECLGMVWAVEKFRPYLEGMRFTLYSDCSALSWLHKAKDPTGKFSRWISRLQAYDFSVIHVPGKNNEVADALSRFPSEVAIDESIPIVSATIAANDVTVSSVQSADAEVVDVTHATAPSDDVNTPTATSIHQSGESNLVDFSLDEIRNHQSNEDGFKRLLATLTTNAPSGHDAIGKWVGKMAPFCVIRDNVVLRQVPRAVRKNDEGYRVLVPKSLVPTVLHLNHDVPSAGHLGCFKTIQRVQSRFTWDGLVQDVLKYIRSCKTCQMYKSSNQKPGGLMKSASASKPWEVIGIDLKGPYPRSRRGTTRLLVVTDYMTKWVEIFPLRQATTKNIVTRLVDEVFTRFGLPHTIVSDNGKQFVANIMKNVCAQLGVKQRFTSYYHPQSNQTERVNRNIAVMLAAYVNENQQDYDANLQQYAFALRTAVQESTGFTPAFLNFGRELRSIADVVLENQQIPEVNIDSYSEALVQRIKDAHRQAQTNLQFAQKKQKSQYDKTHRYITFDEGQRVLALAHHQSSAANKFAAKLASKFNGPYVVAKKLSDLTYRLRPIRSRKWLKGTYHVTQLKPFLSRDTETESQPAMAGPRLRPRDPITGRVRM